MVGTEALREILTPQPEVQDLDALNAKLAQDCLAEMDRTDAQGQSYRALWEAEKSCLMALPAGNRRPDTR